MGRGILTGKLKKCIQKHKEVNKELVVVELKVLNGGSLT